MDVQKNYTEEKVREMLKDETEFERAVYMATFRIPCGKVSTYGRVARKIGKPNACRAVANALHNNPIHPIVPCQRVVLANGGFGGRPDHADGRRRQLAEEGVPIKNGRVVMTDDIVV